MLYRHLCFTLRTITDGGVLIAEMYEYISREAVFQVIHGIARGIADRDTEVIRMSIASVTNKRNRRKQALLDRKNKRQRKQAFKQKLNNTSVNNQQKEKPTIFILYER